MVVLYSNHCPLCNRLKEVLDNAGVLYEEVNDIATMEALGIDRTPMLRVDTETEPEMLKYAAALKWVEQRGTNG
jgi:glutaredoxin-related protein